MSLVLTTIGCVVLPFGALPEDGVSYAAVQTRQVFGPTRIDRTLAGPESIRAPFDIPEYVTGPYQLVIYNGNAHGDGRVAVEDGVSSARVFVDDIEVVGPREFSRTVAIIEKPLSLAPGSHEISVTLNGAAGSYLRLSVAGTIVLEDLPLGRTRHSATLLSDGSVLIIGGQDGRQTLGNLLRFSSSTRGVIPLEGRLSAARANHTATLLPDGQLLLVGGGDQGQHPGPELLQLASTPLRTVGLDTAVAKDGHTATQLLDGRVLFLGGRDRTFSALSLFDAQHALVFRASFNPQAGRFLHDETDFVRSEHTATLLPDGRILVLGGYGAGGLIDDTVRFVDSRTGRLLDEPSFPKWLAPRAGHTATLLPDGRVLILGGATSTGTADSAELFDPATGTFHHLEESLSVRRREHTAVLLPLGEVLVTGGENEEGVLASQEYYRVPVGPRRPAMVERVLPENDAVRVETNQIVAVQFSTPIDVRTLNGGTMHLSGEEPVEASVVAGEHGLLGFLVPKRPLTPGASYGLSLAGDITGVGGSGLAPLSASFTVARRPHVRSFSPDHGVPGTVVTILGEHFDPLLQRNLVYVNDVRAAVVAASEVSLSVVVPETATTGVITVVTAGGAATTTLQFAVGGLSVHITRPNESVVNARHVLVAGFVEGAHGAVAVSVNGYPALVDGRQWIVEVALVPGQNHLRAQASDVSGRQATAGREILVEQPVPSSLILRGVPQAGVAPLTVRWEVVNETGHPLVGFEFDELGTGSSASHTQFEGVQSLYVVPGLYLPVLRAFDRAGRAYTTTTVVQVLDRDQTDAVIQGKWTSMKSALERGDIEAALTFFAPAQQGRYRTLFTALGASLGELASGMGVIQLINLVEGRAKYRLRRVEVYGGQTVTMSYYVYFVQDSSGDWKIEDL